MAKPKQWVPVDPWKGCMQALLQAIGGSNILIGISFHHCTPHIIIEGQKKCAGLYPIKNPPGGGGVNAWT
jgi:hypothetical protein